MLVAMYDFDRQLTQGEQGEAFLDSFFAGRGYTIVPVSRDDQRTGIDRIFTDPAGHEFRIEYKTDFTAVKTGNAFIETISVDSAGKMGWSLTSTCDYLVYYVPGQVIYMLAQRSLRWALTAWMREYPTRTAKNNGYSTHGLLVPLEKIAEFAEQKFPLA